MYSKIYFKIVWICTDRVLDTIQKLIFLRSLVLLCLREAQTCVWPFLLL